MSRRASVALLLSLAASLVSFGPMRQPSSHTEPVHRAAAGGRSALKDPLARAVARRLASRGSALVPAELDRLSLTILEESQRRGFSPSLVLAVIEVESGFDPFAVSRAGAVGLMQVLPSTGAELAQELGIDWRGMRTLFDPVANVRIGLAYLERMRERFGHLPTALAAYNRGPGAIVRRVRSGAPIPLGYSERVLSAKAEAPLASS